MSEPITPSPSIPSTSQLEVQNILAKISRADVLELPSDKERYLTYGYWVQCGRIPLADGKIRKIASTDPVYLPVKSSFWSQTLGTRHIITVKPLESYTEDLPSSVKGEMQLKLYSESSPTPNIKILFSGIEVEAKIRRFNSVLIVNFPIPKKAVGQSVILTNCANQEISLIGSGSGLMMRYTEPVSFQKRGLIRKLNRAKALIMNGEFRALVNAVYFNCLGSFNALKRMFLLVLLLTVFTSCVLPPDMSEPRVFSREEISYISNLQKGIYYSQSGRFDLAELNLRKALLSAASPPTLLLSNLGFVLRAQGKFVDAVRYLKEALQQDRTFLHARVILGRTYFEMGEIDLAIQEYLTAEGDYYGYWNGAPDKRLTSDFNDSDILSVFTNLAILYAERGLLGEAICYSQKALDLHNKGYKPQAHARFLISIEQFYLAGETLRQVVYTGSQITAPLPPSLLTDPSTSDLSNTVADEDPSTIQDLGVVRLLENDLPLAAEAFDRILTLTIVPEEARTLTELLRYEVANSQNDTETVDLLNRSFMEDPENLCESSGYATPTYWPLRLRDRILERRKLICRTYG